MSVLFLLITTNADVHTGNRDYSKEAAKRAKNARNLSWFIFSVVGDSLTIVQGSTLILQHNF